MGTIKTIATAVIGMLLTAACTTDKGNKLTYHIEGTAEGLADGQQLQLANDEGEPFDTIVIKNGKFTYDGKADSVACYVINVMSDESMLLKNAPTVRRIISMLRFIDLVQYNLHDDDDIDKQQLKESIGSRASKKRLNDQRISRSLSQFIKLLAQAGKVDATQAGQLLEQSFAAIPSERNTPLEELLAGYAQELQRLLPDPSTNLLTLVNIVEHIMGCIMDQSTAADTAFLLAFQTCVNKFSASSPGGTVREFLRYWDQHKDKLTVASTAMGDAVTVMTIHKSKGLEFDCVVVPFANWEMDQKIARIIDGYRDTFTFEATGFDKEGTVHTDMLNEQFEWAHARLDRLT